MNSTNFSYLRSVKKFDPSVIKGANRMTDKTAIEKIRSLKRNAENDMPEYDYGWDAALDKAIEALATIEAEKPAETGTARLVAQSIIGMALADYSGLERQLENDTLISIEWIQQYAESYHAERCEACRYVKPIEEPPKCTRPYLECHARRDGLCLNVLPCLPLPEAPRV